MSSNDLTLFENWPGFKPVRKLAHYANNPASPDRPGKKTGAVKDRSGSGSWFSQADRDMISRRMKELAFKAKQLRGKLPGGYRDIPGKINLEADRLRLCGQEFAVHECPADQHKFRIASSCKSRICDHCAETYGRKIERQLGQLINLYMAKKRRGWCVSLLTLTFNTAEFSQGIPSSKDLQRIGKNLSDFMRLFYGKYKAHRTPAGKIVEDQRRFTIEDGRKVERPGRLRPKAKDPARKDYRIWRGAGAVSVLECGSSGNLHFHCITYGPYIPKSRLVAEWLRITGKSYIVDIEAVKNGTAGALHYLLKYVTKPPLHDSYMSLAVYAFLMKGLRRIRQFGVMYNAIHIDKPERLEIFCLYCGCQLQFRGVHRDPHNSLIDYISYRKYVDRKADKYIRLPYGHTADLDWTAEEVEN